MCEQLDWFYVSLLGFERAECAEERVIAYRAENCTLRLSLAEGVLQHPSLRPLGVQVPSLAEMINRLIDAQIDFEHVRGLAPGQESILLSDPAGNAAEVSELRAVS
jgi:catechol-2,3-dioxygenase